MKHTTIVLILLSLLALALPVAAQDDDPDEICFAGRVTITNDAAFDRTLYVAIYDDGDDEFIEEIGEFSVGAGERFNERLENLTDIDEDYEFIYSFNDFDRDDPSFEGSTDIRPCENFTDGRLNWFNADAPAVVYEIGQRENGRYDIYRVENGDNGQLSIRKTTQEVQAVLAEAVAQGQNLLIEDAYNIQLYALASNECQINALKPDGTLYEFIFQCSYPE